MGKKNIIYSVLLGAALAGALFISPVKSFAQNPEIFNSSGLPIPRFVSLSKDKVFVRTGPALRYPIKWIYVRQGLPVEIVQEFDTWRKIRDVAGEEGWIHQSLLSGKRNAIIAAEKGATLLRKPESDAKAVAQIENGTQVTIESCESGWCQVEAGGFSGWIEIKSIWGVYESEELD